MKYTIKALFIMMIIFSFCLMGCGDDTSLPVNNQVVICTGHTDWWPAMWNDANSIVGVGPDLVKLCLADADLEISCTNQGTWSEILAKAKNGEVDIIVGSYWMKEREEYMFFTDKYLSDPVALITSSKSNIKYNGDWNELKQIKLVGATGATYGQDFNQYIIDNNINITRVNDVSEAYNMLETGQADGFVYSYFSARKHLSVFNLTEKFTIQSPHITTQAMHICISKKSKYANYIDQINLSIKKYKENGTIDKLINDRLNSLQ